MSSRSTKFLFLLIAIEIASFIAGLVFPGLRDDLLLQWRSSGQLSGLTFNHFGLVALLGYSLAHSGPMHLLFNMLFLWILGSLLAQTISFRSVFTIYLLGILAGGTGFILTCMILHPYHQAVLCGASAGILALGGALWQFIESDSDFRFPILMRVGNRSLSSFSLRCIIICIILMACLSGLSLMALSTHLCGFLAGYICGFIICNMPTRLISDDNHSDEKFVR